MATMWTNEQLDAINKEGTNIIVSAGAGSGKTAVLTERVIRKLKSGVPITRLLILTFTNMASKEMKDRIRESIKNDESLKEQLNLLDTAFITTFDSYALSIVKKYHYKVGVSNNIEIAESSIIDLKKIELMDKIFNSFYCKDDALFIKLITDFCIKDDKEIKDYILTISNKLDMKYDKIKMLSSKEYHNKINELMNNMGIYVMDKEDDFDTKEYTFSGLNDIYESFMLDVAGACEMPVTKLFGRNPAGFNATGESDLKQYYDTVEEKQD